MRFPEEPGRRSRLYAYKDVCDALKDNTGKIETIFLDMPRAKEAQWSMKAFSKMTKLRLLKIHNVDVSEGPEYLSNELRFLEWHAYPSKSLPACFQPDELVELYMSCSSIEQLWYERKISVNLKIINLSNSLYLTNTPDFTGIPNLESLILEGCASLSEVHPSFGRHKKLQFVNLFPDIVGNMNCLRELRLDGTAITELPSSFNRLAGLVLLNMSSCKNLESIPSSISGLKSLKKLDVSDCSELKNIPENLGKVESLEEFDASGTSIRQPPASFFLLKNLKVLSFNGCKRLTVNLTDQVLPSLSGLCSLEELDLCACNLGEGAVLNIGFLSSLRSLNLSKNNFVSLPKSINHLSRLEKLALKDCVMLESLPEVPLQVQKTKRNSKSIKLSSMNRSEFKCLNCWELYKHNGQNNMGLSMLEKYLQGSLPRPGFGIVVPEMMFQTGLIIKVRIFNRCNTRIMGAACVAFSAYGKSPLFCHFKVDGKESYPSPMYIGCNSMQAVSDHLWLFYLSFDYLKDLKEQNNKAFSNLELSFHSYERGVKVKNCGVHLVNSPCTPSWQSPTGHLIVASKEAASSYIDSLANSLSYNQWMHDVFCSIRGVYSSNNFTHLYTALVQKAIIHDSELENLRSIESSLLGEIKESGLSVIISARDYACSPWWFDELIKIVGFIKKMKSYTVFPVSTVSYNVEQSKVDERTESYMIVFDKDEEDFGENKEKETPPPRKRSLWAQISSSMPSHYALLGRHTSFLTDRVNDMDWPVGNKFHGIDLESVLNFLKKIRGEGNERDIDFEFDVTQLVKS
uniref:TIR domain-containing protein n=1 Tax=Salix viminalis TaxID=40686 RepID=A0A6N2MA84_SALVM